MTNGESLALSAMVKELKILERRVDSAKEKRQGYINSHLDILEIRREAFEVIESSKSSKEKSVLIDELGEKEKKAVKLSKLNLIDLIDKEHKATRDMNDLQSVITSFEYRLMLKTA